MRNFLRWQTAKAGEAGFVLGLPGLVFQAVAIPADLTYTTYLHLRMVVVISMLYGWDPRPDRVKTLALLSLLGSGAGEILRDFGVQAGIKLAASAIKRIPGKLLVKINQAVGFRLATKFGAKGLINFVRFIPFVGGLFGGGFNAVTTWKIGHVAQEILEAGPEGPGDDPDSATEKAADPLNPSSPAAAAPSQ